MRLTFLVQVGGVEEYKIVEGIKRGRLTKPIVAWCIGTCAKMFTSEVRITIILEVIFTVKLCLHFTGNCLARNDGFCFLFS